MVLGAYGSLSASVLASVVIGLWMMGAPQLAIIPVAFKITALFWGVAVLAHLIARRLHAPSWAVRKPPITSPLFPEAQQDVADARGNGGLEISLAPQAPADQGQGAARSNNQLGHLLQEPPLAIADTKGARRSFVKAIPVSRPCSQPRSPVEGKIANRPAR